MPPRSLGLVGAEAYVLGAILGSGVFSVLGVVVHLAGSGAWLAYLLAGAVAVCSSAAYVRLNAASECDGGAVTLVLEHGGRPVVAGVLGWVLLAGFGGLLAMYGYAFGAYAEAFLRAGATLPGWLPVRPLLSGAVVVAFVGVNWAGPTESSRVEAAIVALTVALVAMFAVAATWHVHATGAHYDVAVGSHGPGELTVAAATAFVSLVAWQLLVYDQSRLRRPETTVERTVAFSLPTAILGYAVLSALVASLLRPGRIARRPELVLVHAVEPLPGSVVFLAVSVVALGAMAAAVNAVLFSTTLFLDALVSYRLFPGETTETRPAELPTGPLLAVGTAATLGAAAGRIEAIVEFASLAFVATNGVVSGLALRAGRAAVPRPVALTGLVGSVGFLGVTLWWLAATDPALLAVVGLVATSVVGLEVLYFDAEKRAAGGRALQDEHQG